MAVEQAVVFFAVFALYLLRFLREGAGGRGDVRRAARGSPLIG